MRWKRGPVFTPPEDRRELTLEGRQAGPFFSLEFMSHIG
jgi:hypothetical protein